MTDGARRVGVVAGGDGALAVGVALASGMLWGAPARTAVVVVAAAAGSGGQEALPTALPGLPAARRLAASLSLREIPARASRRLVVARLDDEPAIAWTQAQRIDAAAADLPVVTVLRGPRCATTDALLDGQDCTVLAVPGDAPAPLLGLAAAEAGKRVERVDVSAAARALTLTGLPVLPALRRLGRELAAGTGVRGASRDAGQALLVMLGALLAACLLAVVLGAVAMGLGRRNDQQRAADLAALAAATTMAASYADVMQPLGDRSAGHGGPARIDAGGGMLDRVAYLGRARATALATARRNGARRVNVTFPDAARSAVPLRVAVAVVDDLDTPGGSVAAGALAEAEVMPPAGAAIPSAGAGAGQYTGPLEHRDGKPMRPDVARAYDRLAAAAHADGVPLVVVSGFRSDAEQAVLFARHPDPKWVAPPGTSLHRLGTELDLGPVSAYRWLARHAPRFGFLRRYPWEPWHYGYARNAGSAAVGFGGRRAGADGEAGSVLPAWVPGQYRPMIARAAQRWNVGAVLLAAQVQVESGFDPTARSPAGAQGIAQFMPATARRLGLADPWDAAAAIDAQAHLMRNLLRTFGAVPLALAAYNAGEGAVLGCRCAGPYAETRAYVARILALVLGSGDVDGLGAAQMTVRLVR